MVREKRTHTWCSISKCITCFTFGKGDMIEEDILRVIGDEAVDVHRLGLWMAVNAANQLVIVVY
jgi:hypothetical protein